MSIRLRPKGPLLLTVALLAAGCTQVEVSQPANTVIERTATETVKIAPNGPVAARVLPYALLSGQAYEPKLYAPDHPARVRQSFCTGGGYACPEQADADRILAHWRIIESRDIGALGVQIWVRTGNVCEEAVIAFRGTERYRFGNWVSNLHLVLRPLPYTDQYERVANNADTYVERIVREPCYRPGVTRITAVGHSLGAGLAQHASYAQNDDPLIARIYGFDSTFVTGYHDPGLEHKDRNATGLVTERIYEHGEILAYPNFVLRQLNMPSECNPRVVSVRFDLLSWTQGLVGQHNLRTLTARMLHDAHGLEPDDDALATRFCSAPAAQAASVPSGAMRPRPPR